ncbi:MAG: hypothetical protein KF863_21600 [Rubrivivax sp.]|nr:hypothetical protein [Rubrivivax sp.]
MTQHTSDRAATLVRTRTGILIGSAYVRPPPVPGTEAERIQASLLRKPQQRRTSWSDVGLALAIGVALGWALVEFITPEVVDLTYPATTESRA